MYFLRLIFVPCYTFFLRISMYIFTRTRSDSELMFLLRPPHRNECWNVKPFSVARTDNNPIFLSLFFALFPATAVRASAAAAATSIRRAILVRLSSAHPPFCSPTILLCSTVPQSAHHHHHNHHHNHHLISTQHHSPLLAIDTWSLSSSSREREFLLPS
jgi:hypothetical protein